MADKYDFQKLLDKYAGKRFGSWVVGKKFKKDGFHWFVDVHCDCGDTLIVNISCIPQHDKCTCAYLRKIRAKNERVYTKTDLERIWPAVIEAGRKAMEMYHGLENISSGGNPEKRNLSFVRRT